MKLAFTGTLKSVFPTLPAKKCLKTRHFVRSYTNPDLILHPIYRVSGSAADVGRLKKAFEVNPYEAEQLLKDVDIHSVAGTLKLYLREMPESLVTTPIYQKMFEAFSTIPSHDMEAKKTSLLNLFSQVR